MTERDPELIPIDNELYAYKRGEIELLATERYSDQKYYWQGNQDMVDVLGVLPSYRFIAVIRDRDGEVTATSFLFLRPRTPSWTPWQGDVD